MSRIRFCICLSAGLFLIIVSRVVLLSAPPSTKPAVGLRENPSTAFALVGAKIVVAPGRVIDKGNLVIRDGVITAVGADVRVPKDARILDVKGRTIYSGLIDAFSEMSADTDALKKGATYWNPLVRPQLDMASQYQADKSLNEKLRGQGITARLVAPSGGIIKGTSTLVSTGDQPNSESTLKPVVAQHVRLTVSRGRDRKQYPNSPMGAVALARQAVCDAKWYGKAWTAYRGNRSLPRPEQNDALDVLQKWLDSDGLVIADTSNELFFLRADRFAREFGLNLVVRGSGNEYRRLDAIQKTGRAVIVPVDFPKPPNVATSEAAMNVSLEQMMHWDIAPENPARLAEAGVHFALTSHGLKDVGSFLEAVRKAVARGLSPDSALRALTTTPAELFQVSDRVGTLESGKNASFIITDGDLFEEKTKVLETWVDGRRFEIVQPPVVDVGGTWRIELAGEASKAQRFVINLTGEPNKRAGTIRPEKSKAGSDSEIKLANIGLSGARLSFTFDGKVAGREGTVQLSSVVEVSDDGKTTWIGNVVWPDGSRIAMTAVRTETETPNKDEKSKKDPNENKPKEKKSGPASFAVNFPLGAFGRSTLPEQPPAVLLTGATIWTCGEAGVIEDASLLIGGGKVLAIGTNIKAPRNTVVINVRGSHITPGIIDCHSHSATDGGVNESAQAITAEVRIGDFIDCDDIAIYRQLAGGVTCANILHGSANPIGGQNQVIKFRWGMLPEELKFSAAPQGIKFALGENVKQSNWGDDYTTRYPQTRMGVDQIIRDEFQAARHYQQCSDDWQKNHQGLLPRRDLELEAICEILQGKRWIHCHSYRQDEILALMRTLDGFGVRIGTFQHILEGYKVADAMARHGAMGSAFSDWWAYKFEVYDAIPYNGALMHKAGVNVSFNSDDRELARHLNHEAAKAVKYGGVEPVEALKFVTLNPAKQLRIDRYVGSLEVGKDADFAVWSGPPLSNFSRCEQTWVDGRKHFDRKQDAEQRANVRKMRATLIQKILASGEAMRKPGDTDEDPANLWPREDEFCHHHTHDG